MRYHRTGQDNWTPRQPSGLLREQVYGRIQPMEEEESALARFSRRFAYFTMGFVGAIAIYHVARALAGEG